MVRVGHAAVVVGVVAVVNFHCASPEFTTAKIALGQRDYPKAVQNLELETHKNPSNVEAWLLLAQLRREVQREYAAALQALREARRYDAAGRWREQIAAEELALWVAVYNDAIVHYNALAGMQQPPAEQARGVIERLRLAIELKPDVADTYGLLGLVQELAGDTGAALQSFARYRELLEPLLEATRRTGITFGLSRAELLERLGAPVASRTVVAESDTLFIERWLVDGQPLYVFSAAAAGQGARVEGWRYRPPQGWTEAEQERYTRLMLQPLATAAITLVDRGNLDTALAYTNALLSFSPGNEQGMNILLEIYDRQGRTQELLNLLERFQREHPERVNYRLQYAIALTKLERYEEAVRAYEEVLQKEPANALGLFNGAVAYKNWAGKLQQEELEKRRQNPRYQEQRERYVPLLRRSAELFERYRELPGHRDEFAVLEQLVNIYEVLPEPQRLARLVAELEQLEPLFVRQPRYYELLGSFYARRGDKAKAQQYYDRADQLRKQP